MDEQQDYEWTAVLEDPIYKFTITRPLDTGDPKDFKFVLGQRVPCSWATSGYSPSIEV